MEQPVFVETHTWDGLPVSPEPPFGATVVVYRCGAVQEFLLLHRAHRGPDFEGDWAWGPPAGARLPGEAVFACACRELAEETGLRLHPVAVDAWDDPGWAVFMAQAPAGARVRLSPEHDRFVWVRLEEAVARCRPRLVARQLEVAAREIARRAGGSHPRSHPGR
ncbi:MAG TPA: NUDIX domain-containing protein [Thermaerobacter sp.]